MPDDLTITLTPEAQLEIQKMHSHVINIIAEYGTDSDEYRMTADSLMRVLADLCRLGGRITRDGDLSLYGVTHYGMHYGIVWFPKPNPDHPTAVAAGEWSVHS